MFSNAQVFDYRENAMQARLFETRQRRMGVGQSQLHVFEVKVNCMANSNLIYVFVNVQVFDYRENAVQARLERSTRAKRRAVSPLTRHM